MRSIWGLVAVIAILVSCSTRVLAEDISEHTSPGAQPFDASASLLPTEGLLGRFEQRIEDAQGELLSQSRGQFALRKPHFFRWSIEAPGQQLLVADGSWLWQYDLDLETITRQPLGLDDSAPLRLLTQSMNDLARDYRLEWTADLLTLTPLSPNADFDAMRVHYRDDLPQRLTIDDNLGQTIDIVFTVDANEVPSLSTFVFEPPDTIDVYTQES